MGITDWQKVGKQGRNDSISIQLSYISFCIIHRLWIKMPVREVHRHLATDVHSLVIWVTCTTLTICKNQAHPVGPCMKIQIYSYKPNCTTVTKTDLLTTISTKGMHVATTRAYVIDHIHTEPESTNSLYFTAFTVHVIKFVYAHM